MNLIAADFSAIEVRVLAWLSTCHGLLDAYRNGRSPYMDLGQTVTGEPAPKGTPGYAIGKQLVLACGYGQGGDKFGEVLTKLNIAIPDDRSTGLPVTPKMLVDTYRSTYYEVPRYWKRLQSTALSVVHQQTRSWIRVDDAGLVAMAMHPMGWLMIRLPSGRCLWYAKPNISQREAPWSTIEAESAISALKFLLGLSERKAQRGDGLNLYDLRWAEELEPADWRSEETLRRARIIVPKYRNQLDWHGVVLVENRVMVPCVTVRDPVTGGRGALYGGLLAENVTQAVARDCLAEKMLACETLGWPIVLTVHDELVVEDSHVTLDMLLGQMREPIRWARGLPLDAEGFIATRYRK